MIKHYKTGWLITGQFIFILFSACHTSLKIRPSIKTEFVKRTEKLTVDVAYLNNSNIGLLTAYREDTLNKEMFIPSNITITNITVLTDSRSVLNKKGSANENLIKKPAPNNDQSFLGVLLCKAMIKNDTLILDFVLPFNQSVQYKILKNNITGLYSESYKSNNILKRSAIDNPINHIELPIQEQLLILNEQNFIRGRILFGKANFKTGIYFIKDEMFKGGFLKKQIYMDFIFRVKIQ